MLKEIKTKTKHYFVDENGNRQGEYKRFFHIGQLYTRSFYQDDQLHGEFKSYHNNGQLWVHSFYQDDTRHGEYKSYHDNGQLSLHAFYQNGTFHGERKNYHDDGTICAATFYHQGNDLRVNPDTLTDQDKTYILLSGRLPPRDQTC
jgi:antitoxin component YwqK of YwqJK toxin-antitoxin module